MIGIMLIIMIDIMFTLKIMLCFFQALHIRFNFQQNRKYAVVYEKTDNLGIMKRLINGKKLSWLF